MAWVNQKQTAEDRRIKYLTAREAGVPAYLARVWRDYHWWSFNRALDSYVTVMNSDRVKSAEGGLNYGIQNKATK